MPTGRPTYELCVTSMSACSRSTAYSTTKKGIERLRKTSARRGAVWVWLHHRNGLRASSRRFDSMSVTVVQWAITSLNDQEETHGHQAPRGSQAAG